MVDLAGLVVLGVLAADDFGGELEVADLDQSEVDGEDQAGDHQPRHDPRERGTGDGHLGEDEVLQRGGDRIEEVVDRLFDAGECPALGPFCVLSEYGGRVC